MNGRFLKKEADFKSVQLIDASGVRLIPGDFWGNSLKI
jgi:hypothetical protein